MQVKYKIIILIIIYSFLQIYSQVSIDYPNSQVYTLSEHCVGSFITGVYSDDTIADTSFKKYGSIYVDASCTVTCEITKSINDLHIQFDIFNQHNGYWHSKSIATIHVPLIIPSKTKYKLYGNYSVEGKHKTVFQISLFDNTDTLFSNTQVSTNLTNPSFTINSTDADSISRHFGDTTGELDSGKQYIIDFKIGFIGKSDDYDTINGKGTIDIDLKLDNVSCLPQIPVNYTLQPVEPKCYYNLLGQKVNKYQNRRVSPGIYLINDLKILSVNKNKERHFK